MKQRLIDRSGLKIRKLTFVSVIAVSAMLLAIAGAMQLLSAPATAEDKKVGEPVPPDKPPKPARQPQAAENLQPAPSQRPSISVDRSGGSIVAPSGGVNKIINNFGSPAGRPWIQPAEVSIGSITWKALGANIPIRIVLKNTGQSPALYVDREEQVCVMLRDCLKWISDTRARLKQDNYTAGKPIFPNETSPPFIVIPTLVRRDVELWRQEIDHAVHSAGDPLPPPNNDPHLPVPVYIAYVIDYLSDVGREHHQSFCWLQVHRVNPINPAGLGISIQLDQDTPSDQLITQDGDVGCGAD